MEINCPDAGLAGRSYDGPNETKRSECAPVAETYFLDASENESVMS